MSATGYSTAELMAVVFARDLRDGEIGTAGVGGLVPMAAMMLAQRLHAPNLVIGGELYVNPAPPLVADSIFDDRGLSRCEAVEGFAELFGYSHRGLDFFFHNGVQIDRYGNVNLHAVGGSFHRPAFRGPGVANVSFAVTSRRFYLYPSAHTPRNLVDRVDFVSIAGNLDGPESRRRAGLTRGGPRLCVTPLCVFDFDPDTLTMRLSSVHPGASVDAVLARTGFRPIVPGVVPVTPEPTALELAVLREVVDPHGLLRR